MLESPFRPEIPEDKPPVPAEYLCPLCCGLFASCQAQRDLVSHRRVRPLLDAVGGLLVSVVSRPRKSTASQPCQERPAGSCPLCARQVDEKPVANRRLAEIVESLNLDFFELPKKMAR